MSSGISLTVMNDVLNSSRARFRKGFIDTQRIREYVMYRWYLAKATGEPMCTELDWTIRRAAAPGSTQGLDPFEAVAFNRQLYDVRLAVRPKTITKGLNQVYDRIQIATNINNPEKLWSITKMTESATEESFAEEVERILIGPHYNDNDKLGIPGLLSWYGRSCDSSGNFVVQTTPARNGVRVRLGDGTLVTTVGGVDRSLIANSRLRSLVATHGSVVDQTFLRTLQSCVLDSGFRYLEGLQGDTITGELMIIWDDQFDRDYDGWLNNAGGPRKRDAYESGPKTIQGASCMAVPFLNNHFMRPIIGIRPSNIRPIKFNGMWGVDGEMKLTHNAMAYPTDYTWTMKAEDPSSMGFLCHGQYTNGL